MKLPVQFTWRLYLSMFALSGVLAFGAQGATAAAAGGYDRQCYYDSGTEPRCQYCEQTCLGEGYVCCAVVVQPTAVQ